MSPLAELGVVVLIVLIPTVPACFYLGSIVRRRRTIEDVTSGRAPETPFVVLAWVGIAIAVAAFLAVAATLLARAIA
jgi:hypothetical protein